MLQNMIQVYPEHLQLDNISKMFTDDVSGAGGSTDISYISDDKFTSIFSPMMLSTMLETQYSSPSSTSSPICGFNFNDDHIMLPETLTGGYSPPAMPFTYVGFDAGTSCSFIEPDVSSYYPSVIGDFQLSGEAPTMYNYSAVPSSMSGGLQPAYSSSDMQVPMEKKHTPASLPILEDSNLKIGRLSIQERKEKIHRYLKKRNERNFTKKIKYACRKTLADSRPRVRGRFAKNDELGETLRSSSIHHEHEDVMVKGEEDMFDSSDIFAHISGVNSFKYNYTIESWI
ncbi:CCT domain-containing protein [Dioscorea alata]|uniref:CCT domain-containing protein n=1 Tax=Dioscorea alata TaxID=55571 RepID=A0ACB7UPV7_DIOAL|nr:CCT domain-containing protein [Dioscorea alata]